MLSRVGAAPLRLGRFCCYHRPLEGFFFDHIFCVLTMDGAKDGPRSMYTQKKKKLVIPVWRPVSTQSGSGVAASLSSSSADYDNQYKGLKEKQSTFSCEIENLSERHEHASISGSHKRVEVIEESMHGYSSNEVAGLASDVEKHSVTVEVDASLVRFIKGKWGSTQKQIEGETGVKILFPSSKNDNYIGGAQGGGQGGAQGGGDSPDLAVLAPGDQGVISQVIEANSDESVTKASEKIANVLEEVVKSPRLDYSHFISLPLAIHPDLVDKLQKFQNAILGCSASGQDGNLDGDSNEDTPDDSDNEGKPFAVKLEVVNKKEHVRLKIDTTDGNSNADPGIDKSIFIKPKTFHLTVLMLKLWNKDRIAAATEVFQKISSQVNDALDNRPVFIALKGLECMRGSPAMARVVYAPVEEIGGEGRLLRACQVITKAYVEAGLVLEKDARQTLKLHATLMNARHRKGKKTRRHDSFDARGIFLRYGSEKWGDYLIREAHLSQRFVFDEGGYYHCCASIPFPESMQVE